MNEIEIMKIESSIRKVESAKFDKMIKIKEYEAEIIRLKENIKIQEKEAERLKNILKE